MQVLVIDVAPQPDSVFAFNIRTVLVRFLVAVQDVLLISQGDSSPISHLLVNHVGRVVLSASHDDWSSL